MSKGGGMRFSILAIALIPALLLASCDDGGGGRRYQVPPLPMTFQLDGTASATQGDLDVDCVLRLVVEISGEVSRTDEVVEYIATMGGDVQRNLLREDGSG
jgi:hypothetical protein